VIGGVNEEEGITSGTGAATIVDLHQEHVGEGWGDAKAQAESNDAYH
jgi:hypothetical protein